MCLGRHQKQQRMLCVLSQKDLQDLLCDKALVQYVQQWVQNALLWKKKGGSGGNNTNFCFYLLEFEFQNASPLSGIFESCECTLSL